MHHLHEIAAYGSILLLVAAAAYVLFRNHRNSNAALGVLRETTSLVLGRQADGGLLLAKERLELAPGILAYHGLTGFGYQVHIVDMKAGSKYDGHIHQGLSECFVLLKGRLRFTAGDPGSPGACSKTLQTAGPESPEAILAYALPGQRHELEAVEDTELVVISKPPIIPLPQETP